MSIGKGKAPSHQRARGGASLRFLHQGGRTRLGPLYQAAPMRVLFPNPDPGEPPVAALVNTAGGLAGGDQVELELLLDAGAGAVVTTPAAEKIYRSLGPETRIATRIGLEEGAVLEWLPQETILFDGARLTRRLEIDLAPGAVLLAAEMLVFGRTARGESLTCGRIEDGWRLRRDGRMLWADGLALEDALAERLASPFGFAGAEAMATLILAAPGVQAGWRDALREEGMAASLLRPDLLVLRWLGGGTAVRDGLGLGIRRVRAMALGRPARLPRLWTT